LGKFLNEVGWLTGAVAEQATIIIQNVENLRDFAKFINFTRISVDFFLYKIPKRTIMVTLKFSYTI
jgi:hypothetical protein